MNKKYTKEFLKSKVKTSISYTGILKKLGFKKPGGSAHRLIRKLIKEYKIDISHFKGQGWAKGLTGSLHPGIKTLSFKEIFKRNSKIVGTKLRFHYKRLNLDYRCSVCGIKDWREKELILHIDHINGVSNDNRVKNLRWICPNCHQQTETWGWTKKRNKSN